MQPTEICIQRLDLAGALGRQVAGEALELEVALRAERVATSGTRRACAPGRGRRRRRRTGTARKTSLLDRLRPAAADADHALRVAPLERAWPRRRWATKRSSAFSRIEQVLKRIRSASARSGTSRVAERLEHPLHALGVVLVHLAPEGGDVEATSPGHVSGAGMSSRLDMLRVRGYGTESSRFTTRMRNEIRSLRTVSSSRSTSSRRRWTCRARPSTRSRRSAGRPRCPWRSRSRASSTVRRGGFPCRRPRVTSRSGAAAGRMPLFSLALGAAMFAAFAIGDDRPGVFSFGVMAAVAALFFFGGRSETLRGHRRSRSRRALGRDRHARVDCSPGSSSSPRSSSPGSGGRPRRRRKPLHAARRPRRRLLRRRRRLPPLAPVGGTYFA